MRLVCWVHFEPKILNLDSAQAGVNVNLKLNEVHINLDSGIHYRQLQSSNFIRSEVECRLYYN